MKPQHPNQPLSHQRLKPCSYPSISEMLRLAATGIIKKCVSYHRFHRRLLFPLDPPLLTQHWVCFLRRNGRLQKAASSEQITGICISPGRDGGMRAERREGNQGGGDYLCLTGFKGLCLQEAFFIMLHFRVYQSPRLPPHCTTFPPAFVVTKSLFLLQLFLLPVSACIHPICVEACVWTA